MTAFASSQTFQDILIAITIIGGSFLYFKVRVPAENVKNLKETVDTYVKLDVARQKDITDLRNLVVENERKHAEEVKALIKEIGDLTGQVKVYKELPLRELADGIKEVVTLSRDNAETNKKVLGVLENTAKINAEDREGLTGGTTHVKTEVHKTIEEETKAK